MLAALTRCLAHEPIELRATMSTSEATGWLEAEEVAVLEERARIARDLHDSVSQLAIGALYELQAAKSELDADGAARDLASNEDVKEFYLGVGGGDRKSFRDVKSYKRRKRWLA